MPSTADTAARVEDDDEGPPELEAPPDGDAPEAAEEPEPEPDETE